ncbi:MAG TPA: DUF3795 domain-containing protein [Bacteroidales bacterium]|nr:DUF3795 domain-containing protein [Bacteroidales bacterium]
MDEYMMSYCGLHCRTCPIHLATLEPDQAKQQTMRASIAQELSKIYGTASPLKEIPDCDGCRSSTGVLFTGCADCGIRKCARDKNLENCAFCESYPCGMLLKHYVYDPDSRKRLDEIRMKRCQP